MHRDPQPVKLYTVAPMYRYAAPQKGRFREHWQCSVEAIGSADPAIDAEVIQLYTEFARRVGITQYELQLNSIGDANCRPAYVERLTAWLDDHADVLDDDARQKRATSPLQVFDVKNPAVREALEARRRSASRSAPTAGSISPPSARFLDAYGVPTRSSRPSCAGSTTTRARCSSSSARRRRHSRRSAGAAATTASSRRSAARRRRGSASAPGSSGRCSRSSTRESPPSRGRSTSSSSSTARRASRSSW